MRDRTWRTAVGRKPSNHLLSILRAQTVVVGVGDHQQALHETPPPRHCVYPSFQFRPVAGWSGRAKRRLSGQRWSVHVHGRAPWSPPLPLAAGRCSPRGHRGVGGGLDHLAPTGASTVWGCASTATTKGPDAVCTAGRPNRQAQMGTTRRDQRVVPSGRGPSMSRSDSRVRGSNLAVMAGPGDQLRRRLESTTSNRPPPARPWRRRTRPPRRNAHPPISSEVKRREGGAGSIADRSRAGQTGRTPAQPPLPTCCCHVTVVHHLDRDMRPRSLDARHLLAAPEEGSARQASSATGSSRLVKNPRPSVPPASSGSTACSGWGIRPTTLRAKLVTPAMSRTEPLGLCPAR